MSQKSSTFANVIELERHIEILLLSNDCVIVPDLGGFMTHYVEARYDEEDNMFLPPQRTLVFNPQLKLNDSLLAQSFIEAYDISYPEAIRRIESEVSELKQYLYNEGFYELNDLGVLKVNDEGKLEFEPCEAGILTPELYGLSSFEAMPLSGRLPMTSETSQAEDSKTEETAETIILPMAEEETVMEEEDRAITIKMSWVRNVIATAAAILLFFVLTTPVSNDDQSIVSKSQITLPIINKDSSANATDKLDKQTVKDALQKRDTVVEKAIGTAEEVQLTEESVEAPNYCIVLASQVSRRNAEEFVSNLQKKGIDDARVYLYNNIRRVVCGSFKTEAEAYQQLQKIHQTPSLADAWVYKMKH